MKEILHWPPCMSSLKHLFYNHVKPKRLHEQQYSTTHHKHKIKILNLLKRESTSERERERERDNSPPLACRHSQFLRMSPTTNVDVDIHPHQPSESH